MKQFMITEYHWMWQSEVNSQPAALVFFKVTLYDELSLTFYQINAIDFSTITALDIRWVSKFNDLSHKFYVLAYSVGVLFFY